MVAALDGIPRIPGLDDLRPLSQGVHTIIYEAVQTSLGRRVAVKVDRHRLVSRQEQQRLVEQATTAGRLAAHPHILSVLDVGVTGDGLRYLIMELCASSYADRVREAALPWAEACQVGSKIADALAYAHADGVPHGAVKPANILITEFGQPVLADFDLSMVGREGRVAVPWRATIPEYPAPEASVQVAPTAAMDVYSLSATLYVLLSGRAPQAVSPLWHILNRWRGPIRNLKGVPAEFTSTLRAGMARHPHSRPSAAQLRDLLAAIGGRSKQTVPVPRPGRPLDDSLSRRDRVRESDFEISQEIIEWIGETRSQREDDGPR